MKTNPRLALAVLASFIFSSHALALPTIVSQDDQIFEKNNDTTIMDDIVITDDATTPVILAGELRITIPDGFQAIFDSQRTSSGIVFFGAAEDAGKVDTYPEVGFEDGDKTIVITVNEDFEAGESFTVRGLYLQGFHTDTGSDYYLSMSVGEDETTYTDSRYIKIDSTLDPELSDDNAPDTPTNIQFEMTDEGIVITWDDPTDLDLNNIHILRGVDGFPVDASSYELEGPGDEYHLDDDLKEGTEVSYILRASDGRNISNPSEQFDMVYYAPVEEEITEETEEEVVEEEEATEEESTEEEETTEETEEEEEESTEPHTVDFDDVEGHWGEDAVEELAAEYIIEGDPDGSFRPNDSLNRAEAATLIARIMYNWVEFESLPEDYESPFSDLSDEDWYFDDVVNLYAYGAVSGNPDGSFEPSEAINRAEFLTMAVNLYDLLDGNYNDVASETEFADVLSSDWFAVTVELAADQSWVQGSECDGEACFFPANEITRAEAAQILHNIFYYNLTH